MRGVEGVGGGRGARRQGGDARGADFTGARIIPDWNCSDHTVRWRIVWAGAATVAMPVRFDDPPALVADPRAQ